MNQNPFKFVWLALTISIFAVECKSSRKTVSITAPEKAKISEATIPSRNEAEELVKLKALKESTYKGRLLQYFDVIANSDNLTSANNSINEVLTLFASSTVPVRIVINQESGIGDKDYESPITIRAYLNYLKDQKQNINQIKSVKLDAFGKITEVELQKNILNH